MVFAFWASRAMTTPAGRVAALLLALPSAAALPSLSPNAAVGDRLVWAAADLPVLVPAALVFTAVTVWTVRHRQEPDGEPSTA
jgi:hypothetical protein